MSDSVFEHQHRVIYSDCTVGNHIYYARYLDLLEEARGEFFRAAGWPLLALQENGTVFPVIEVQVTYQGFARYDDLLTIELWITEMRGARLDFGFRIVNAGGSALTKGRTRHVCTGLDEKPKRLPKELADSLARFVSPENETS
jgi:acyl-CoA thioester hydrolase